MLLGPQGSGAPLEGLHNEDIECRISIEQVPAGTRSPVRRPARTHEILLALGGSFQVLCGDWQTTLHDFDCCLVPAGTPRVFENVGGQSARLVSIVVASIDAAHAQQPGVARSSELKPVRARGLMRLVPEAFLDVLSPRDLYLLVGPHDGGRPGVRHALGGPQRFLVALARTPLGNGPAAHIHRHSDELFLVLQGRYKITWGDCCEHSAELGPLDLAAFPPGVNRTFEAIADDSVMLPVVVGANDELQDIVWLRAIEEQLAARVPALMMQLARLIGLRFIDREESAA